MHFSLSAPAVALALVFAACTQSAAPTPPLAPTPLGPTAPSAAVAAAPTPWQRADALIAQMTLDEKIAYIGGHKDFFVRAVPRLGIPEIKFADGPAGCRNWGPSTAYPAAVSLAASFDPHLVKEVGQSIARDCRARGVHVLLAPGVNIARSPLSGRNFEYMGEDPFLASSTVVPFIRGVQAGGVLATVKHFVANNQEWDRNHISSEVDERTLREIYFPAFEAAVKQGPVGAVMTAYNLVGGTYATHNSWLLKTVLRDEWGFQGLVMSDWSAAHSTLGAAQNGLDLEMPAGKFMNAETLAGPLADGTVTEAMIDEKVRHLLATWINAGFFERSQQIDAPTDDPQSAETALEAARKSVVLLKNEGALLPLAEANLKRLLVVGPNAHPAVVAGSGSAFVTTSHAVSVLDGLKAALPNTIIDYHPGVQQRTPLALMGKSVFEGPVKQELFNNQLLEGPALTTTTDRIAFRPEGKSPAPGIGAEHYSIRWTGKVRVARAGRYKLMTNADDGIRVRLDGKLVIDDWSDHAPRSQLAVATLAPGVHEVVVEYYQGILGAVAEFGFGPAEQQDALHGAAEVTALAKAADAVVVCVGFGQSADTNSLSAEFAPFWPPGWARDAGVVEAEDSDRPFALPKAQVETLKLVGAANPRTVALLYSGGGVDLEPWLQGISALVWTGYPGQEGGTALGETLLGRNNPSAKLPVTFAKAYEDYPSASSYHLKEAMKTPYAEGVLVGYRGFDSASKEPAFPFGFGLSYTQFAYSALSVHRSAEGEVVVEFDVQNTGPRPGSAVAQVYVSPPATSAPVRAPRTLQGFDKVELAPGATSHVTLRLPSRAFAYWQQGWVVEKGLYGIEVGDSSRHLPLHSTVAVP